MSEVPEAETARWMVWGERFSLPPDRTLLEYSSSIATDKRLWKYDIECSRAHIQAQVASGVLSANDAERLKNGLSAVEAELATGRFRLSESDEDIHVAIERRLGELTGEVAGRLHAGRSRNDQVVTDFRLWVKDACKEAAFAIVELARALESKAVTAGDALVCEYTHLQRAQPIPLAHHLLAHVWPLLRDCERLRAAFRSADTSPLGAAAGAGSSLISDTSVAARELGFGSVFENSVDAVSDRDFAADFLYALAIAHVHMSRLAEELVIWSSEEFGFVELSDSWATGSSIMPQKKNPDVAELARGRTSASIACLLQLLVVTKGLPLAYNRDLQEDKEAAFKSFDTVVGTAKALAGAVSSARFDTDRMRDSVEGSFALATEIVEELVRRGVPFREAHRQIARLVRHLVSERRRLSEVGPNDLEVAGVSVLSAQEVASLRPAEAVSKRRGKGMAGFEPLKVQFEEAEKRLAEIEKWAEKRRG
ncbi:MAG: argininosuccinate lyase [Acidimicrobiia bacterium]